MVTQPKTYQVGHRYLVHHPYDPVDSQIVNVLSIHGDYLKVQDDIAGNVFTAWLPCMEIVQELPARIKEEEKV